MTYVHSTMQITIPDIHYQALRNIYNFTTLCYSECPDGTYSLVNDTTCQPCPDNTVMTGPGDTKCICNCLEGYFRYKADVDRPNVLGIIWPSSDEGPRVGCTRECLFKTLNSN